jgi:chromate transporter
MMRAITAAVVGVIANLAVWFASHVLVPAGYPDLYAVVITTVALIGLIRWRWSVLPVVLGAALLGVIKLLLFSALWPRGG